MVKYADVGSPREQPLIRAGDMKPMTVQYDPRFPNQNQTRHCYVSFLDFHRCKNRHSEEYEACKYFERAYKSLCPRAWVEKWHDQMDNGTFPAKL